MTRPAERRPMMGALMRMVAALAVGAGLLLLAPLPARADAPWERYWVDARQVGGSIRERTVGVLTVSMDLARGAELNLYDRPDAAGDTRWNVRPWIPVSNFDYLGGSGEAGRTGGARFPIAARQGDWYFVAIDPFGVGGGWVRRPDLERIAGPVDAVFFDAIDTAGAVGVDIFYFTRSNQRKLYARPAAGSPFRVIEASAPALEPTVYWITGRQGDYLQIGGYDATMTLRPIGWVRIHDDAGRLMIWLAGQDLC